MEEEDHSATVLRATGRQDLSDALAWIMEGRRLTGAVRTDELMAALASLRTPNSKGCVAHDCPISVGVHA